MYRIESNVFIELDVEAPDRKQLSQSCNKWRGFEPMGMNLKEKGIFKKMLGYWIDGAGD